MSDNMPEPKNGEMDRAGSGAPEVQDAEIHAMSRRSFLWGGLAIATGTVALSWLNSMPKDAANGIQRPFRAALEANERISRSLFSSTRLAATFPRNQAREPRVNGDIGLPVDFDPGAWELTVSGLDGGTRRFTLDDIKKLERVEMVTELKCIEGWSVIVHWAGARLADFVAAHPLDRPGGKPPQYVAMATPDGGYYVGLDIASALHPQTLLCYEMNGAPLTVAHGAPLRLAIPVKYGIKNIKRIGSIYFTNERPDDYWAKLYGYDWYAGH